MLGSWFRLTDDEALRDGAYYYTRKDLEAQLARALRGRKHILLYGLPRQGKSTLLKHALEGQSCVTVHASRSLLFEDVTRNYLLAIGCSVHVENKKRVKSAARAEVKFNWPLISAGGGGEIGEEGESTERAISANIGNPNDVSYLIKQFGGSRPLIVDGVEQLRARERAALLEFARMCHEDASIKVILVYSSVEVPLDFGEKIKFLPYLILIHVPPLSRMETGEFIRGAFAAMDYDPPRSSERIHELFGGAVGLTLDACRLLAAESERSGDPSAVNENEVLEGEFHAQLSTYYLALLSAIVEEGWEIYCQPSTPARAAKSPAARARPARPQAPPPITTMNFGVLLCMILLDSDLEKDVEVTDATIASQLEKMRLKQVARHQRRTQLQALAKKVGKLQRKLLIEPNIISSSESRTKLTLWKGEQAAIAAQVKSGMEAILETYE